MSSSQGDEVQFPVDWIGGELNHGAAITEELDLLRHQEPSLAQAVDNVKPDIRSSGNPHGNLSPELVAALEEECRDGEAVTQTVADHCSTKKPHFHRQCTPSARVTRVLALSDFVSYHLLGGVADQSEIEPWLHHLRPGTRHQFDGGDLKGRTGSADRPCWWCFSRGEREAPDDGRTYVEELALGNDHRRRAQHDGAVVEVTLDTAAASDRYFKPTSLEGFGPDTPFRPELSGADFGMTVPEDSRLSGWPEVVSPSSAYTDILNEGVEARAQILAYSEEP